MSHDVPLVPKRRPYSPIYLPRTDSMQSRPAPAAQEGDLKIERPKRPSPFYGPISAAPRSVSDRSRGASPVYGPNSAAPRFVPDGSRGVSPVYGPTSDAPRSVPDGSRAGRQSLPEASDQEKSRGRSSIVRSMPARDKSPEVLPEERPRSRSREKRHSEVAYRPPESATASSGPRSTSKSVIDYDPLTGKGKGDYPDPWSAPVPSTTSFASQATLGSSSSNPRSTSRFFIDYDPLTGKGKEDFLDPWSASVPSTASFASQATLGSSSSSFSSVPFEQKGVDIDIPPSFAPENTKMMPASGTDWFKKLFGAEEKKYVKLEAANNHYSADGQRLFNPGTFELCNMERFGELTTEKHTTIKVVVGDVSEVMNKEENYGATFQAASQFNCLEFVEPEQVPEQGITGYIDDRTQGPAVTISTAPATYYRNYLVPLNGKKGQSKNNQLNMFAPVNACLVKKRLPPIQIVNGYSKYPELNNEEFKNPVIMRECMSNLQVGVQWDAEVTCWNKKGIWYINEYDPNRIATVVCSAAFAIGYHTKDLSQIARYQTIATALLEQSYRLTLATAYENMRRHKQRGGKRPAGHNKVFLTLVGNGVFANDFGWILTALQNALLTCPPGIEVYLNAYNSWQKEDFITAFEKNKMFKVEE